ncbi:MAG: T9SS type A sorting domain-containing protein [Bacteroidia bacterium]
MIKKHLLSFGFVAIASTIFSQPILTSSTLINSGANLIMKTALVQSVIDTTIQGANKTWDFSGLQPDNSKSDMSFTYMNQASTPYASNFPGANYCYKEVNGTDIYYNYFNLSSTKCDRLGSYYVTGSTLDTYSDPQTELVFPLTMGTKNLDTWASSASTFGGTYSLECVGYGTLKLPGTTYYNVLMVRVIQYELTHIPIYFWYASNGGVLLEDFIGDGLFFPKMTLYTSSFSTGIKPVSNSFEISLGNPVQQNLEIAVNVNQSMRIAYQVLNTLGESTKSGQLELPPGTGSVQSIDVSSLKPGIYFFSFHSEDNHEAKIIKFVKY